MSAIEHQIDTLEKYAPKGRAVDEVFSLLLTRYVELIEEIHSAVLKKRNRSGHSAISEVNADAGLVRIFNRDLEGRHRQLLIMASFAAYPISYTTGVTESLHGIPYPPHGQTTKVTKTKVEARSTEVEASFIYQLPMVAFLRCSVHGTCLQGTRQAVLQTVHDLG